MHAIPTGILGILLEDFSLPWRILMILSCKCSLIMLCMLRKSKSYGNPFSNVNCTYHQSNEYATSNCIELKHKVQDLIDDKIVDP